VLRFQNFVIVILLVLMTGMVGVAQAQRSFLDEANLRPFTAGGNISFTASAYTIDGIENRRPPGLIVANASMSFTTFGLSSGLELNYSSDDTGLRQNVNTFSYSAAWRWINVRAGDVNARFSEYGLNGATVRGGYLKLDPGDFLLELTGGRTRRAVQPSMDFGFREPSFEQWAMAGKIGYGNTGRSYFHISTFYAIDEKTSVQGTNLEITPRENLTVSPDFQVRLFNGRFTIGSEVTASIFTRDLNSSVVPLAEVDIPSFMKTIFVPRVSSRVNYAGRANMTLSLDLFTMSMGYMRVQPGFESLGKGRVRDDQERIQLSPTVRLFQNRVNVSSNFAYGRDNLMGNRLQTQHNTNVGTNVQVVVNDQLSINTTYNLILNNIVPEEINGEVLGSRQSQTSHNLMLQPSYSMSVNGYNHNISLTGGYLTVESIFEDQMTGNDIDFKSESFTGAITYAITMPNGLSFNATANGMANSSPDVEIRNMGFVVGSGYALFSRKLNLSANAGFSDNQTERESMTGDIIRGQLQQLTGTINASYNLTANDTFSLVIRARSNMVREGAGSEFTEMEGSFRYQRRF